MLPKPEQLLTPLHFSEKELDLFTGSHLHVATADRRNVLRDEWQRCLEHLTTTPNGDVYQRGYTWEQYLTAATYIFFSEEQPAQPSSFFRSFFWCYKFPVLGRSFFCFFIRLSSKKLFRHEENLFIVLLLFFLRIHFRHVFYVFPVHIKRTVVLL